MGNCDVTSIEICDIIYAPYVGLTYTILDKIKPLWKSISEPSEIRIGSYRGNPGQQCRSGPSYKKSAFILIE